MTAGPRNGHIREMKSVHSLTMPTGRRDHLGNPRRSRCSWRTISQPSTGLAGTPRSSAAQGQSSQRVRALGQSEARRSPGRRTGDRPALRDMASLTTDPREVRSWRTHSRVGPLGQAGDHRNGEFLFGSAGNTSEQLPTAPNKRLTNGWLTDQQPTARSGPSSS